MNKSKAINFTHSLAVFLCLTILLSGCGKPATPASLTPITVQLSWIHQTQNAGLYAAAQNGYYAAEGLEVTFVEGGSKVDKLVPVLNGTAQFGMAGADEVLLARSEGKPLRAIATIYRRSAIVFVSLAEKGITRPQDFVGKTIRAAANVVPTLHAIMTAVGVSRDQYNTVDLPTDLAVFASGEVPVWGMYINSTVITAEQAGYKLNLIFPDDYGVHFYGDTLITTDKLISTNPDVVQRFLRATLKGWTYAVENADQLGQAVQQYNPKLTPAIITAQMTASIALVNTGEDHIGWMKPEMWAGMEETLRKQGVLTAALDVTQAYTLQFLKEIYK
jgi:NitT/TauT family transport system substrate-binding protein